MGVIVEYPGAVVSSLEVALDYARSYLESAERFPDSYGGPTADRVGAVEVLIKQAIRIMEAASKEEAREAWNNRPGSFGE